MPSAALEGRRKALASREHLLIILGKGTCHVCLEPLGSPLHEELCEVSGGQVLQAQARPGEPG